MNRVENVVGVEPSEKGKRGPRRNQARSENKTSPSASGKEKVLNAEVLSAKKKGVASVNGTGTEEAAEKVGGWPVQVGA